MKHLLFTIVFIFSLSVASAQQQDYPCLADEIHKEKLKNDVVYKAEQEAFEKFVKRKRSKGLNKNTSSVSARVNPLSGQEIYQVPVVVHVMHNGEAVGNGTNISDERIKEMIKEANNRYRKIVGTEGDGNGVDTDIEFSLAVRDPNGNCTNGINRIDMSAYPDYVQYGIESSNDLGMPVADVRALSTWNLDNYINIWIVSKTDSSIWTAFAGGGRVTVTVYSFNFANTLAHEIGHVLNLRHTFYDDDPDDDGVYTCPAVETDPYSEGDFCADTPRHVRWTSDCTASNQNPCYPNDPAQVDDLHESNYMTYGGCGNRMFTPDQTFRMRTRLESTRYDYLASQGNTGLIPPAMHQTNFKVANAASCTLGSEVYFFDDSSCIPNTYLADSEFPNIQHQWTFTNGTSTLNSFNQNPVMVFNEKGYYDVTLTVTTAQGTQTLTKEDYIYVSDVITTPVCTIESPNVYNLNTTIFQVNFNTLDGHSNVQTNEGYRDFTCSESTILKEGETYPLSIYARIEDDNYDTLYFKAYIDYNADGAFDDSEMVAQGQTSEPYEKLTTNVTVPSSAIKNKLLTMRIVSDRVPITTPCGSYIRSDVEDYGILIKNNCDTDAVDFESLDNLVCVGAEIQFHDKSCVSNDDYDNSTTYNWTFTNGTTTYNSTEQHPRITFNDAGVYDITLQVTTPNDVSSVTKESYINIIENNLTQVCTNVNSSSNSDDRNINRVQFNVIDKQTSVDFNGNYQDYRCSDNTVVEEGEIYTLSITTRSSSASNLERFKVYIDYNNNGNFDVSELVFQGMATSGGFETFSTDILIPDTAVKGVLLTMRVIGDSRNIDITCGNFRNGDVEDYGVIVLEDPFTYIYNDGWLPSDPNGVSTTSNDIEVISGNAVIFENTDCKSITIDPGASLTVDTGITLNTFSGMSLKSNSTAYSSLILDGSITGNIEYHRHVNIVAAQGTVTGDNDLISSPLSGETFGAFRAANPNLPSGTVDGNQSFLFGPFNNNTNSYEVYGPSEDGNLLASGIGYRTGSMDNGTFTFTGIALNEMVNVSIDATTTSDWYLIGNPYPSYMKVQDFLNQLMNSDIIDENATGLYGYDGSASDGWVIYNLATTDNSTLIAPGQGFFIQAEASGDISFTPSMRTIGMDDDFIAGRSENDSQHLKLGIHTSDDTYTTDFYFNEHASLGLDRGYDASLWGGVAPTFALYSNLVENHTGIPMAIQALNNEDIYNNVVVPLGVNAFAGIPLTFDIVDSTLPSTVKVYLEDVFTNTTTLLTASPYLITPSQNINEAGRFFLRFEESSLSTDPFDLGELLIYTNPQNRQIVIHGKLFEDTSFKLYDIQGRLVTETDLESQITTQYIDVSTLSQGVYIAELNNGNRRKTQKIILN